MSKKNFSPALILSLGTLGSYLLGFIRDPLFGHAYGKSSLTDAYFNAFQISDIFFLVFISSALLGLVIPLYEQEKSNDITQGNNLYGNFFLILNAIFLGIIIVVWWFLPALLEKFFSTSYALHPKEIVDMGKLFLVSNFIFGISNFIGTFSMAHNRFISTALAPLFYNLGIIAGIYFFADTLGIYAAAYGVIFGAFLHLTTRLIEYYLLPEKFSLHWNIYNPALKELIFSMVLRWGTVTAIPVILLIFATVSNGQSGLYTLFRYTHNLQSAPIAIFGLALATASFPVLSKYFAQKKREAFSESFWNTVLKILFWTIPGSIVLFALGADLLSLLYNIPASEFSFLIPALALIISLEAISHVFSRACNAMKKPSIPLWANAVLFGGAMITMMILLVLDINVALVLSSSYAAGFLAQTIFYSIIFRREKNIIFRKEKFIGKIFPIVLLTIAMIVITLIREKFFSDDSSILSLLFSIATYGIIFFSILILLWKKNFLRNLKEMI